VSGQIRPDSVQTELGPGRLWLGHPRALETTFGARRSACSDRNFRRFPRIWLFVRSTMKRFSSGLRSSAGYVTSDTVLLIKPNPRKVESAHPQAFATGAKRCLSTGAMVQFNAMIWKPMLAYIGSADQELLLRNAYLATENRLLKSQIAALGSWFTTPKRVHEGNDFNSETIREVAWLFLGIFATMPPALAYLCWIRGICKP
jgi:hypothetical protein